MGAFFALVIAAMFVYARANTGGDNAQLISNVRCDANEQVAVHYHAHLDILNQGQPVTIPANIGIQPACLYWLHTHDSSGVLHIEAPVDQKNRTFTLGDFFSVWHQPLDSKHVATLTLNSDQKVGAFVDGKPYSGDPRSIPLKPHSVITLEITPPTVDPPPPYTFASGL